MERTQLKKKAGQIEIRRKEEIYYVDGGWFTGRWHFSFGQYYDPRNMSFGTMRVFNVDTLKPGAVWPLHPHKDMEVITYCVEGEFQHADSLGNDGILNPGDVQHTTIGKGMWHSEINHSKERPMTFIQVWILPRVLGLPPSVEQRHVDPVERLNKFLPLVSNEDPDALQINQDAAAYAATVEPGILAKHSVAEGYGAYLYVVTGKVRLNGQEMAAGDAARFWGEGELNVEGVERSELFMVVVRV